MTSGPRGTAPPRRAMLPMADQRRSLPLLALFLVSSFAVALTVGSGLGAWLLLHATLGLPLPESSWSALVQVHGHAQLVGFAGLLIMGLGYRILPRFRSASEPPTRFVLASYAFVAGGLVLRPVQAWPGLEIRGALLLLSGGLVLAGLLVYARIALGILASGSAEHRPDELFLGSGAVFGVVGALWDLIALAPAVSGAAVSGADADAAAVAALLLGFVGAHIIGVSVRVAPAFIAAPPAGARLVVVAAVAWAAGTGLMTIAHPLGPILLLVVAIVLLSVVAPFGRGIAARPLGTAARITRGAFRSGYLWLVGGLGMLAFAAVTGEHGPLEVAGRHALALGFLVQMVFAVGSRLVPALSGGDALPPRVVLAAVVLANVAALLRVVFELIGPSMTFAAIALGASGPVALAALAVFAAGAVRTMRSALGGFV